MGVHMREPVRKPMWQLVHVAARAGAHAGAYVGESVPTPMWQLVREPACEFRYESVRKSMLQSLVGTQAWTTVLGTM